MHRSHSRGPIEKSLKLLGLRPYRCSSCDWRGFRRALGAWRDPEPPTPVLPAPESTTGETERKKRRSRNKKEAPRFFRSAPGILVLAIVLGAAGGVVIHPCQDDASPSSAP